MSNNMSKPIPFDFTEAVKQDALAPMERDVVFGTVTPAALEPVVNAGLGEQNINDIRSFTKVTQADIDKRFAHLVSND